MNKLQKIIDKRATIWQSAMDLIDKAPDGNLTPENEAKFNEMTKDIDTLTKSIDRMKKMNAISNKLNEPINTPIRNPIESGCKPKDFRATKEYREAAVTALRTNFKKITDILMEGQDTTGGYLIPDEWDKRLIDVLDEENVMRGLCHTLKTSGEHKINIADSKPTASWIEEGQAFQFSDGTFDQKILDAHKLHVGIKVTDELLYDAMFDIESYIITCFGKAIANAEEDAFINGDGVHKPFGIFDAAQGGQRKVTTNGVKISADDVMDLIYALKRPYRKSAKFLMNDNTVSALRKLKDATGQYLWQPALTQGEPDKLLGYPVLTSAYCPVIETGKACIAFGDFSHYDIGDRGIRSIQELKELFAGNGMIGYLMKERVDGRLVLQEAVQILTMKSA